MTKFKKRTNRRNEISNSNSFGKKSLSHQRENEMIGKCLSTRINITWFIKRKYIEEKEGERDCRRSFGSVTLNREASDPRGIFPRLPSSISCQFMTPPFTPCVCLMSNNFSTLVAWHASGHTFSSFRLLFVPFFVPFFLSFWNKDQFLTI